MLHVNDVEIFYQVIFFQFIPFSFGEGESLMILVIVGSAQVWMCLPRAAALHNEVFFASESS